MFSFLLVLYSCNENERTDVRQINNDAGTAHANMVSKENDDTDRLLFPGTGNKVSDFVPENFEIQYEAEGDLNEDGFPDHAIVVRKKADTLSSRNVLVLLQNPDKTYRLDAISKKVLPAQYNEAGHKTYNPEQINIGKSELNIQLYDMITNGNLFSKFKYLNNNLVLTYVETYSMAAGGNTALYYEVIKGKLTEEVLHIIKEEPFLNSQTYDLAAQKLLFENASPQEVISKAYQSVAVRD